MKKRTIEIFFAAIICIFLAALLIPGVVSFFGPKEVVKWTADFNAISVDGRTHLPEDWKFRKKPGTPSAVFSIEKDDKEGISYLRMEADKASGSLVTRIDNIDLEDTPFLKWRWRVKTLPGGADGRDKKRDDQAIGIYVGSGSLLNNKSVSYRWDTDTPRGAEGNCLYGGGTVKVKWFTLRNAKDAEGGKWITEERNVAEDFRNAWGFYPEKVYLSVSCNSQYTGTKAVADLAWIELVAASSGDKAPQEGEE